MQLRTLILCFSSHQTDEYDGLATVKKERIILLQTPHWLYARKEWENHLLWFTAVRHRSPSSGFRSCPGKVAVRWLGLRVVVVHRTKKSVTRWIRTPHLMVGGTQIKLRFFPLIFLNSPCNFAMHLHTIELPCHGSQKSRKIHSEACPQTWHE